MTTGQQPSNNPAGGEGVEQRGFESMQHLSRIGKYGESGVDRLFRPFFRGLQLGSGSNWRQSAQWAEQEQQRVRTSSLLYVVVLLVVMALLWAAWAQVDEVTRGVGKVIPSRQLQVVQSVDGGVVSQVLVQEGQKVQAGSVLVRIDPSRFKASFEESSVQLSALRAKAERLSALLDDRPFQPAQGLDLSPAEQRVLQEEIQLYDTQRNELEQNLTVAQEKLSQREGELQEARSWLNQSSRALQMTRHEVNVTKPLLASGAVSEMDVLRLERDASHALGEREKARARVSLGQAAVEEARAHIQEVNLNTRNRWRVELSETLGKFNSLGQSASNLADRVKLANIRSPVNGTVQRVLFNTMGGVVSPGDAVVEIVPSDDALLVEAKIAPKDIAFLHPKLPAVIKFDAYDFAIYGGLKAEIIHISADTITDERDNTYYLVKAKTNSAAFNGLDVIPGMTVQLDILTGERSVLAYLLKPILRAKANALSER